jgi:hypothetical protein
MLVGVARQLMNEEGIPGGLGGDARRDGVGTMGE